MRAFSLISKKIVMPRTNTPKQPKAKSAAKKAANKTNASRVRKVEKPGADADSRTHSLGKGFICDTEARGYARPQNRSPFEIVLDASEGFIPLWANDVTLHWRFRERAMSHFPNPLTQKNEIRNLLGEALLAWGQAVPVKFKEDQDLWDFEIVPRQADDCDGGGCVLASAFFPDGGRHKLILYPMMFTQTREEQINTLIHEIGHIFGLRHFFAQVAEEPWRSEIFGRHSKFSIMNYGKLSRLTTADKKDLARLYQLVWSGRLTHINGTPIRLVKPYSSMAAITDGVFALNQHAPAAVTVPARRSYVNNV